MSSVSSQELAALNLGLSEPECTSLPCVRSIHSASASCENTGQTQNSSTMREHSNTTGQLTLLFPATRVSATAEPTLPETVKACGLTPSDRSDATDLFMCFERMFLEISTQEPLSALKVTLQERVTRSGHTIFQLQPSVPLMIDPGRGRWPTPTAQDAKNATMPPSQAHRKDGSIPCMLARMGFIGWVLNPRFYEELMMFPVGWTELDASVTQSSRSSLKSLAGQS